MRYVLFLSIGLLFYGRASAQEDAAGSFGRRVFNDLARTTVTDLGRVYGAPFQFRAKQWLITAGVGAGVVLSFTGDPGIQSGISQAGRRPFPDFLNTYVGEPFGNRYFALVPLGAYLTATALNADRVAEPAAIVFRSTLIAASASQLAKFLTHRQRPDEGTFPDPGVWYGPGFGKEHLSFFSRHTASAFAMASALSTYYKDKAWVAIVTYSLATVAAWARIYANEHWFSDVVTGAVIGTFVGSTVARPDKYRWSVSVGNGGNIGIGFTLSF